MMNRTLMMILLVAFVSAPCLAEDAETPAKAPVKPAEARYDNTLKEFVLTYEAVRTAADPDQALLDFLIGSYEAAANGANWDRAALECPLGVPGKPRAV